MIGKFFFRSFSLLAACFFPVIQWVELEKKRGRRKEKKEKDEDREREREREKPGFDLASIWCGSQRTLDRLPEANRSTLRGNGQMVWKLLDSTSSRIGIPLCIFPHVRFPVVSEFATNRRMENPAERLVYGSFDPTLVPSRLTNAI